MLGPHQNENELSNPGKWIETTTRSLNENSFSDDDEFDVYPKTSKWTIDIYGMKTHKTNQLNVQKILIFRIKKYVFKVKLCFLSFLAHFDFLMKSAWSERKMILMSPISRVHLKQWVAHYYQVVIA